MLTVLKGFDYMHARSIKLLLVALIVSGFVVAPVGLQETALAAGTTYYVDCVNGNDRANGTSTGKAWKTLERANKAKRSEEHTSELQSRENLVCRLLLEKKKQYEN